MRNYGTNVYSNNFEPQVNGVLDARTKIEGPASDLTLDSTWTSKDGKQWACAGLVVSVVNDPENSKNGLYLLLDDDYSQTSNWKFIGSDVDLSSKQDVLVSGQNIKTINGNSLLGSGNLEIQGGGSSITVDDTLSTTSTNPVQNKVITEKINTKQDSLVSGTSIKTINSTSLLGSGNISIPKGDKGDKGDAGINGTNGITPTIGSNGNWFLGSEDTGKPSRGEKGDTAEVEPTVITLNTTGMLDRERKTLLTLDPSDANKLAQLVSNESNYANCIITYCGLNATSSSDWRERVALNYTGDIFPPSQSQETKYDFWLSFTSSIELEVYYFEIQLTIPAGGGSPTATASVLTKNSDITIKRLTTNGLFKYGRGEEVSISSEDKEILVSLFGGGYKNAILLYAYDGLTTGGNSYSTAVNVSGLLDGTFSDGNGDDLTLTTAAEGMVYKEILTYDKSLSTWTTKQDPVVCTEEIEADVKKTGYWWDRKTGFIIQWGVTDVISETNTTAKFPKPMNFLFNATATPGANNNSAILQIGVVNQALHIRSDANCTVFWQAIGRATE